MRQRLLSALFLLFLSPIVTHAQWVQDGLGVSTAINTQAVPVMTTDGAGGIIVAWQDNRGAAMTDDIYAQRVDATGVTKWTIDGVVVTAAANFQSAPVIVSDGAGGAIIAWTDFRSGVAGNWDVYAQRINPNGVPQWTANGVVVSATTNDQNTPKIVSDGAGGAIVVWSDHRSGTSLDVYAQRINSGGVAQWTANGVSVCRNALDQTNYVATADGAGGVIVAWQDARFTGDIFALRLNGSGVAQWALDGIDICAAAQAQTLPAIVADGAGGAVIAWQDNRTGALDIYAQRVNASGVSLWPTDGIGVGNATGSQTNAALCWDNTTGAIIAWQDPRGSSTDIYAARVTPSGAQPWAITGVPVCTQPQAQTDCRIVSDGAGGAVIEFKDDRNGPSDVYAQRVTANGQMRWATDGVPVCTATGTQYEPLALLADGSGGVFCGWYDGRSISGDIYVQRIEGRYGYWGKPEPTLFAAKDVPADQGGKVRLEWTASQRDQIDQHLITKYTIWRGIDQISFASAVAAGVPELTLTDPATKFSGKAVRHDKAQAVDYYWELIGEQNAFYRAGYAFTASTSFDSTAANPATHRFQILAHANGDLINWPSNILTGRSVDNVAPAAPLFLTAQRIGSYVHLKWNGVHVPDLNKYTVYRATSTGVTPITPNFLADDTDTLLTDSSAPASALYYIVTATDVHQNQGTKSNEASVGATTGVGDLPPVTALTVLQNHPNPFTGETQLQVGLPTRSDVHVEVYDVAGRRVRTAVIPAQSKGWNTVRLSARDDRGRALPSGVYFYRVHAGSETVTKKMVIAR